MCWLLRSSAPAGLDKTIGSEGSLSKHVFISAGSWIDQIERWKIRHGGGGWDVKAG